MKLFEAYFPRSMAMIGGHRRPSPSRSRHPGRRASRASGPGVLAGRQGRSGGEASAFLEWVLSGRQPFVAVSGYFPLSADRLTKAMHTLE
jgi:hypothetical protein